MATGKFLRALAWTVPALLAAAALALLAWWLPARARPGYYLPDTRGVITMEPPDVLVFWVRAWPWDTTPPPATVILALPGGQVSAPAQAAPVSFFAPRAVAVSLRVDGIAPALEPGNIASIGLVWSGYRTTFRAMKDLWAMPAQTVQTMPGFAPLVASNAPGQASPLAVILTRVPQDVLAVAAANPVAGPWQSPRCLSVANATAATQGTPQHLAAVLRAMTPGACDRPKGPEALVLAGRPPQGPVAYMFEPIVQVRSRGQTTTVAVTSFWSDTGMTPTAFNWWRFVRGHG
jgi:hypothetical protein